MALLVSTALDTAPAVAWADSGRTPPEATAHARDELSNAIAQGKITLTSTPSPSVTPSATPTATATLEPTEEPTATSTPTPAPCWLTDPDLGDPDDGYIVFDSETGVPVPCPTPEPTDVASDDPTTTPTPTLSPTPPPTQAPPTSPPQQVEVRTVIQTVVVVVTAVPTDTPVPAATATSTQTSSRTPTRTPTPTLISLPTRTPIAPPPAAVAVPTGGPLESVPHVTSAAPGRWDWGSFLEAAAAALVLIAIGAWLLTRRRVVRWGARPNPTEDVHA